MKDTKNMSLSKRMFQIVENISHSTVVADIGCDHGKIAYYILQNNLANKVVISDISKPSLDKATELLKNNFDAKKFDSVHSNGVEKFTPKQINEIDTFIIAGMGGLNIIDILTKLISTGILLNEKKFILQPQNNTILLRNFLIDNNFEIINDKLTIENKKFYNIISSKYTGVQSKLTKNEIIFGKTNLYIFNEDFIDFMCFEINQLNDIIKNVKKTSVKFRTVIKRVKYKRVLNKVLKL